MVSSQIKIVDKGDPVPAFPDLNGKTVHQTTLDRFVVLENGMKSGRASVAILTQLPNGEWVCIETSARIFEGLACAMRGAQQRWGQEL